MDSLTLNNAIQKHIKENRPSVDFLVDTFSKINQFINNDFNSDGFFKRFLDLFESCYSDDEIKELFIRTAELPKKNYYYRGSVYFILIFLEQKFSRIINISKFVKLKYEPRKLCFKNKTCNIIENNFEDAKKNGSLIPPIQINSRKDIPNFDDPDYQKKMDYVGEWGGKSEFIIFNKYKLFIRKECFKSPIILFCVFVKSGNFNSLRYFDYLTGKQLNTLINDYFIELREKARRKIRMIFKIHLAKQEFLRIFNHIRYRPNGNGYNEAKRDFEKNKATDIQIKT